MGRVKNFGHRGFSGLYPENTLLAFSKAIEVGCDGIELDVHLTKDGELVIIHDERVDRTCNNGTGFVRDYTLKELKGMDVSFRFKDQCGLQEIPTLREYFDLVKDTGIVTNIELKTGIFEYPGIERKVYDMIMEYGLKDRIIISSFNHYSVMRMKELDAVMKCGFLTESWLIDAGRYVKEAGVECFHPIFWNLTQELTAGIKAHGIEINTWTVNDEADIRRMIERGVTSIIGNHPDRIGRVIKEMEG